MPEELWYIWVCLHCDDYLIFSKCKSKLKEIAYRHLVEEDDFSPVEAMRAIDTDDFVFYKGEEEKMKKRGSEK